MTTFVKAERTQATLKIALTGPSGSGKTFSGLILAAAIGRRIAVVDTENKSASLYADVAKGPLAGVAFDVLNIEPPYTVAKYAEAIRAAEEAGYDVLLIDSITHAWAGEGGLLQKKEELDARYPSSNQYANWAKITPEHEKFKARILQSGIHVICTMRSKQDYVLEQNEKGKSVPKKVGMAPIQRDGMEYEFTLVFDIGIDHRAAVSKDRTGLFDGHFEMVSKDTGAKLMKWLKAGKPLPQKNVAAPAPRAAEPAPAAAAAGEFPDAEGGVEKTLTPLQRERVMAGIKILRDKGRSDKVIWQGLSAHLFKLSAREVEEVDVMTEREADVAADYLAGWAAHLDAKAAAAAAGKS